MKRTLVTIRFIGIQNLKLEICLLILNRLLERFKLQV